MKLLLMRSCSSCDGEWKQRKRREEDGESKWRMWEETRGRGSRLPAAVPVQTLVLLPAALRDQRMFLLHFPYFCGLFASRQMLVVIWRHSGLTASSSLFVSANRVNVYSTWIWELKPYLNTEELHVVIMKENFCFFILLNLILALTVPAAISQTSPGDE